MGLVEVAMGKAKGTTGALLARQLFALHQVENGHQRTGNIGVDRGVRGLKYNGQQPTG
ncbi:hypothetical protein HORIV_15890 [Vreelandella olivaria]|uniref:Uncharacterized protein n=1 Tax=Vreelandella olivaria TaxID=390919 RepID=A0ABM7GF83_9GAMM|nr:hypothetical protein HORIV_15890 [Halomonas olivaria]